MERKHALIAGVAAAAVAAIVFGIVAADDDARPTATTPARSRVLGAQTVVEEAVPPTRIRTGAVSGLGRVLVNGDGRTLYAFLPDRRGKVTCLRACAAFWAPLRLAPGQRAAVLGGGAKGTLLGSVAVGGGRVATYGGWPLYTFTGDSRPGLAKGQGALLPEPCSFLNLDCSQDYGGAVSYTLTPAGALDRRRAGPDANGP